MYEDGITRVGVWAVVGESGPNDVEGGRGSRALELGTGVLGAGRQLTGHHYWAQNLKPEGKKRDKF